jgi:hypothetical protein
MKQIGYFIGIFIVFIFAIIASGIGKEAGNIVSDKFNLTTPSANAQSNELQKIIEDAVKTARKQMQLPKRVNNDTILTSISARQGGIVYHQKLINIDSREVDIPNSKSKMRKLVQSQVCSNKQMEFGLKKGIIYTYSYVDKNGVFLCAFNYTKRDCGY